MQFPIFSLLQLCTAGVAEAMFDLEMGSDTSKLMQAIAERYKSLERWMPLCALAHNGEYVRGACLLSTGDEVALIPPVSGG